MGNPNNYLNDITIDGVSISGFSYDNFTYDISVPYEKESIVSTVENSIQQYGIKVVLITLIIACVLQIIASLLANRFIMFPLFMKAGAKSAFDTLWSYVLAFNAIKSVSISVITIILYKRVSFILKKF